MPSGALLPDVTTPPCQKMPLALSQPYPSANSAAFIVAAMPE